MISRRIKLIYIAESLKVKRVQVDVSLDNRRIAEVFWLRNRRNRNVSLLIAIVLKKKQKKNLLTCTSVIVMRTDTTSAIVKRTLMEKGIKCGLWILWRSSSFMSFIVPYQGDLKIAWQLGLCNVPLAPSAGTGSLNLAYFTMSTSHGNITQLSWISNTLPSLVPWRNWIIKIKRGGLINGSSVCFVSAEIKTPS